MKSRVYFGFDFFLDLEAYIELDPITTYRSMPHACALKPHPHLPCETPLILPEFFSFLSFLFLFSSFFESVIKVPLHFRSSFLCLFYIYFFLFWFFRFLFFLSFLPFAFFLLSFFLFVLSVFSLWPGVGELWGRTASASHWRRGYIAHRRVPPILPDKFSGVVEFLDIWKLW